MKRFIALSMLLTAPAFAADSVVLGHAVSNGHMDYVENTCPEGYICLHSWYKWVIDVDRTVSGPSVPTGRVVTARMQHTSMIPSYRRRLRLFVLKPIVDPEQRRELRADYFLEETSEAHQMFCFLQNPKDFDLETKEIYVGLNDAREHCFELPKEGE
jgi:hypothetical protein